jgi:hypothetical protein
LLRNLQFTENRDGLQPPLGFTPLGGTLSLYNDASESEVVKEKFAGSYDKIYSIVSLSREIDDGKYQAHVIFWFFIFVAVATFAVFVTW